MKTWMFYQTTTGMLNGNSVSYSATGPDIDALLASVTPVGFSAVEGPYDPALMRVDPSSGNAVARATCPITSSVAARVVTLTGVPTGAAYTVSGDANLTGIADASGALALTFGAAGTYVVTIPCFPQLDYFGSFTLT